MKTKSILTAAALLCSSGLVIADTNDFAGLVQQGLVAEEANHQLDVAILAYRQALEHVIDNRQLVATAIFRLAECYRKEGRAAEARTQYQRLMRDFPDQTELARLSQQNSGVPTNSPPAYILSFGNNGPDPTNNLSFPGGVTVDFAGDVYVSDTHNNRIQKYSSRGAYITQWGNLGTNAGAFDYPQGITTDSSGNVYVADVHNNRVQKFTPSGSFITQWGKLGTNPGEFNSPYSIGINAAGKVFVADANNNRIEIFTTEGAFLGQFGVNGAGPGQFEKPKSVALDTKGNVYIGDTGNRRIQILKEDGTYLGGWGSLGKLPGQFDVPHDIAVDPWGNIYVTDADGPSHNNRVQMFDSDGSILTIWGSLGTDPGQFNFVSRIAVDRSGLNIYVCDASNNRVQLFGYSK